MRIRIIKRLALGLAAATWTLAAAATDISGAGATFPYPIYAKWADAYKKLTGIGLNYQSIGSGGGIKQIKAKTVTFGASDMPLKPEDLTAAGLLQFPMIIGGVVPVVNIKGITAGQLHLDGATVASIYLGDITQWDDAQIKRLNPKLKLPSTAIAPVYRSDGSGTNFLFSNYLSSVYPKFHDTVGANTSVQWPLGIGAKGNEGVANNIGQAQGSMLLFYVEAVCKAVGVSPSNVVRAQYFLTDMRDFAGISATWSDRYGKRPHPFACVQVPGPFPASDACVIGDFWIYAG